MAERLPLGGERESVLGAYLVARLIDAWNPGDPVTSTLRDRSQLTRQWLQSVSLPVPTRTALHHLVESVSRGERETARQHLEKLHALLPRVATLAARADFARLLERLAPV